MQISHIRYYLCWLHNQFAIARLMRVDPPYSKANCMAKVKQQKNSSAFLMGSVYLQEKDGFSKVNTSVVSTLQVSFPTVMMTPVVCSSSTTRSWRSYLPNLQQHADLREGNMGSKISSICLNLKTPYTGLWAFEGWSVKRSSSFIPIVWTDDLVMTSLGFHSAKKFLQWLPV